MNIFHTNLLTLVMMGGGALECIHLFKELNSQPKLGIYRGVQGLGLGENLAPPPFGEKCKKHPIRIMQKRIRRRTEGGKEK